MCLTGHGNRLSDLRVVRRRIAICQLDAAGDSHPLLHRRNGKATIDIIHRTVQLRPVGRGEMKVIAALPSQRQIIAKPAGDLSCPGTGGKHHPVTLRPGIFGSVTGFGKRDLPPTGMLAQAGDTALDHRAAGSPEHRQIGIGQRRRIGDTAGVVKQHRLRIDRFQARLDLANLVTVKDRVANPDLVIQRQFRRIGGEGGFTSEHLHPAAMTKQILHPRLGNPVLVLGQRQNLQFTQRAGGGAPVARCAMGQKAQHPAKPLHHEQRRIAKPVRPAEKKSGERLQQARTVQHRDRGFGQDTGIAIGGFAPRRAAINQADLITSALQCQRVADTDDTAPDDKHRLYVPVYHVLFRLPYRQTRATLPPASAQATKPPGMWAQASTPLAQAISTAMVERSPTAQ